MFYKMPVLVYEEENCVLNHSRDIAKYGKKALIVSGKNSAKINGSYDDVTNALENENVDYVLFDQVEENPSVETVMSATEIGKNENVDFVIGIGGGSPLDASKAIAMMIANPEKDSSYIFDANAETKSIPVVAIPTTCGTGSEVTGVAVLTVHEKATKVSMPHRVFPELALIDKKYLKTASKKIIISTSIDALGHLVESYINTTATDFSRVFVDQGLKIWAKCKDVLAGEKEPTDEDYRNLMLSSMYGGMAIAHTGTTLPHSLSYSITYEKGLVHVLAIGYFIPGYIREACYEDQKFILDRIGFANIDEFTLFYKNITNLDVLPDDVIEKVVNNVSNNAAKLKLCPYYVDKEVLMRIATWN